MSLKQMRSFVVAMAAVLAVSAAPVMDAYAGTTPTKTSYTSRSTGTTSSGLGLSKPSLPSKSSDSPSSKSQSAADTAKSNFGSGFNQTKAAPQSQTSGLGLNKPALPSAAATQANNLGLNKPALPGTTATPMSAQPQTSGLGLNKPALPGGASSPMTAQNPGGSSSALGLNKPALPGQPAVAPAVAAAAPRPLAAPGSSFDRAASRQVSADTLAKLDADRARAKAAAAPVDVSAVRRDPSYTAMRSRYHDANEYAVVREREINVLRVSQPRTVYIVHEYSHPYYGFWDGYFMASLLTHSYDVSYTNWVYAHRYDPAYIQWHQDMYAAAQNDAEVRQQLADIDAKVTAMQQQNVQPQASDVLPTGVSEAVAIAPEAISADTRALQSEPQAAPQVQQQAPVSSHGMGWFAKTLIIFGGLLIIILVIRTIRNRR